MKKLLSIVLAVIMIATTIPFAFAADDALVFGPETRGLPQELLAATPHHVRIPMREGGVRSINLATAAGIVLYAALSRTGLLETWS